MNKESVAEEVVVVVVVYVMVVVVLRIAVMPLPLMINAKRVVRVVIMTSRRSQLVNK